MAKRYWLFKSEPDEYSIDDLAAEPSGAGHWDGIRNYQVRNMIRDDMRVGDGVVFYHSNCKPPAAVGVARIARAAYPDHTQFDAGAKYYDAKSDPADPRWLMVDLAFAHRFRNELSLPELRETPGLEEMLLLRRGNRLSITPLTREEWSIITKKGGKR